MLSYVGILLRGMASVPETVHEKLEKVQIRATKLTLGFKGLRYEEWLKVWSNTTGEREKQTRSVHCLQDYLWKGYTAVGKVL